MDFEFENILHYQYSLLCSKMCNPSRLKLFRHQLMVLKIMKDVCSYQLGLFLVMK